MLKAGCLRAAALLTTLLILAGCATGELGQEDQEDPRQGGGRSGATLPQTYVVRSGDTLFSIARRFGLDHRELARRNRLGDGSLIYPGQRLVISSRGTAVETAPRSPAGGVVEPSAPPIAAWRWPTQGPVLAAFGQSPKAPTGMLIGGQRGQPVLAAAAGSVVYAGSGLAGYGQLVIVKHNASWLSAYGHNESLLVGEGNTVDAGQPIARMGAGAGLEAVLHFEIRRNGEALDPAGFLPRR